MASLLKLIVVTVFIVASFCISGTNAFQAPVADFSSILSPNAQSPLPSGEVHQQESLNPTSVLEPILTNLGFSELAAAVPSLSDSAFSTWNGPMTVFAPSDSSIRTCGESCSVPRLLREHIVPGIFNFNYLQKLVFGTKLETMSPGRCITVTSAFNNETNSKIIFIGGVEITRPDAFNNGLVVVHRLQGFVSPLSPYSCTVERIESFTYPPRPSIAGGNGRVSGRSYPPQPNTFVMRLMLRDAMLRLHNNGFNILALALRVKYPELMNLQNMTIFTLDDVSIFTGGQSYVNNVRFHIVPNRFLMYGDLLKLPGGALLDTLERGQRLAITSTIDLGGDQLRINYVPIKAPDVMYNIKIAVHSVYAPFPHLIGVDDQYGSGSGSGSGEGGDEGEEPNPYGAAAAGRANSEIIFNDVGQAKARGSCSASDEKTGACAQSPAPQMNKPVTSAI